MAFGKTSNVSLLFWFIWGFVMNYIWSEKLQILSGIHFLSKNSFSRMTLGGLDHPRTRFLSQCESIRNGPQGSPG